jgi:hypothetical protein
LKGLSVVFGIVISGSGNFGFGSFGGRGWREDVSRGWHEDLSILVLGRLEEVRRGRVRLDVNQFVKGSWSYV